MLNALCLKKTLIQFSSFCTFSFVGGSGISDGRDGGGSRLGHPQSAVVLDWVDATVDVDADTEGNCVGRTLRSINAFSESKQPLVFLEKYII